MKTIREIVHQWNVFWFCPMELRDVAVTRLFVSIAALSLFLFYFFISNPWFGSNGWFDVPAGLHFVGQGIEGTGASYRWSILYQFPNSGPVIAGLGAFACLLSASGRLAPLGCGMAWVCTVMFQHRAPLLVGICEPLIAASLFYLCLAPSHRIEQGNQSKVSVFGNVAIRLVQVHFALWILFSLTTMLSTEGWWTGESVRRLLADSQGLLPRTWAVPLVAEVLAHGTILLQLGILASITNPTIRSIGGWLVLAFVAVMLFIISDWLYAIAIFATASSIWSPPFFRKAISTS
jgi:hypothetical protein